MSAPRKWFARRPCLPLNREDGADTPGDACDAAYQRAIEESSTLLPGDIPTLALYLVEMDQERSERLGTIQFATSVIVVEEDKGGPSYIYNPPLPPDLWAPGGSSAEDPA